MVVLILPSKLLLAFPLFFSIFHGLTSAQPLYRNCQSTLNYTANSTFESNLNTLLSSLPSNATASKGFFNATIGKNTDTVYGLVLCRGDVTSATCGNCLNVASKEIKQLCPNRKSAAVWYEYCQLRYSDTLFFSLMEDAGKIVLRNANNVSDPAQFFPVVRQLLNNISSRAAYDPSLGMFATEETKFNGSEDVYGLVQCTRDLSMDDCNRCLQGGIGDIMGCCSSNRGARLLSTSCTLRFELYPFYTASVRRAPPPPPPCSPSPGTTSKGKIFSRPIFTFLC